MKSMSKKEIIWREIIHRTIKDKKTDFTQKALAEKFGFSLSTIFNSLKIPRQAGAIRVSGRGFEVQDVEKFLYLWATHRNLEKKIIYKTRVESSVKEIEGLLPSFVILGCYSAYSKKYNEEPADYDKVFVYAYPEELSEIKKRFPARKGYANLIVLKKDPNLAEFGEISPDVQIFADLWNVKEWYAKEFLNKLKEKLF